MTRQKFQGSITGDGYGYVYIMSYPNSDKVKIGHTLNPSTRASQIGGTLAPETPVIEFLFWCAERREHVERKAHEFQKSRRCNGEWFKLSVTEAVEAIKQAAQHVGVETQVAFDKNEYEAKAAKALSAKLAALPTMTDNELSSEWMSEWTSTGGFSVKPALRGAYYTAIEAEQDRRKARAQAEVAAKEAEMAAKEAEAALKNRRAELEKSIARFKAIIVCMWVLTALTGICAFGALAMQFMLNTLESNAGDIFFAALSLITGFGAVILNTNSKRKHAEEELRSTYY